MFFFLWIVDDYRAHTSCMTEAERYEGAFAKKTSKKRNPQEEWMDIVASSISIAPFHLQSYLRTMSGLDNIPRKEKQFRNFTGNSLNLRGKNELIVGEIWNLLKEERDKRQLQKETERKKEQEQKSKEKEAEKAKVNSTKKTEELSKESLDSKKIQKAMKKTLKKAPNRSMKVKELRRQLGDQFGLSKKAKRILKEFLKEAPTNCKRAKVQVEGKIIKLV